MQVPPLQAGKRLGNWLTREQAKELLAVPDRSTLKGKRDYVILALLVGCALRRAELAELDVPTIQLREGRWVLADLEGKGRRIRTVAIPIWVKKGIDAWREAAAIDKGRLLGRIGKEGMIRGKSLSDWAVWSVVEQAAKQIGIERFGANDLRRLCLAVPLARRDNRPAEDGWTQQRLEVHPRTNLTGMGEPCVCSNQQTLTRGLRSSDSEMTSSKSEEPNEARRRVMAVLFQSPYGNGQFLPIRSIAGPER